MYVFSRIPSGVPGLDEILHGGLFPEECTFSAVAQERGKPR